MLNEAMNFSLDCQELAQSNLLTKSTFDKLLSKYNASVGDGGLVSFDDGSAAQWEQEYESWKILT